MCDRCQKAEALVEHALNACDQDPVEAVKLLAAAIGILLELNAVMEILSILPPLSIPEEEVH